MLLFRKKTQPVIGIDISATSIKLVELSLGGRRYKVESCAVEPLPSNAVSDKNINDIEAVGETISKACSKAKTKTKNAAVAVSGSSVITKVITLPKGLSDVEMEAQIEIEADQYIPFPLDEVALDFEVMGDSEEEDLVDVLLAAARSENVDNCIASIESAGLEAKVVDVEAFAMENTTRMMSDSLFAGVESSLIGVVDIGSVVTTFSVMDGLKTVYSREQSFGGAQLTEDIQRFYGISYEEAGMAKKRGGLPDNYEQKILEPFKESIAQQISRALQFFYSSSQVTEIDHLLIAGGCASIDGIGDVVGTRLGMPTTVANPFANMSVGSKVSSVMLANEAPALMVACGLALRGFD